jgi:hypothetical protein
MREIRSYGSVGEQGGNELLYPENRQLTIAPPLCKIIKTAPIDRKFN